MKVNRCCMQTTMGMFMNGAKVVQTYVDVCLVESRCTCVGHMTIQKLHGFCNIIILSSAFPVYSTQTVHIM